jgi:hypothetical protein
MSKTKVLSVEGKVIRETENGKKKTNVCRGFSSAGYTIPTSWKNKTKIISAFEQNVSGIKRFREPERSEVDEVLLKCFKQQRGGNAPMSGSSSLLLITFTCGKF